ncbi:MAG: porin [Tepidisphaeraceae bacterium]
MNHLLAAIGLSRGRNIANRLIPIGSSRIGNILVTAVALVWFLGISRAGADATAQPDSATQDNTELRGEVNQLKAKVDRLESNQPQNPSANEQMPASTRPSIPDTNQATFHALHLTSGYDPAVGFVIRSDDGQFSFHPGIVFQFRDTTTYREKLAPGNGSEVPSPLYNTENGFSVSRMRLTFDGNFTKDVTYYFQLQDDQGAGMGLLDAYAVYHFQDFPFAIKIGQLKDPVWHERNLSESTLMAADRSLVEALLGGESSPISRTKGVSFMYDQGPLRAQAVIHGGFDTSNTKFIDSGGIGAGVSGASGVTPMNYGVSGRAEGILIGRRTPQFNPFSEYDQGFSALGDTQDILVLGGGEDFSQAGANTLLLHSVDLQYDSACGASAYAAYYGSYRHLRHNQGVQPGFYYDPGFEIQMAYLLTPRIEPFARYDYTYLSRGATAGLFTGEAQEITIGANYYLYKQNVRFTLDASYLPDGAPADQDSLGILKDSGHNEAVLRLQFQLAL